MAVPGHPRGPSSSTASCTLAWEKEPTSLGEQFEQFEQVRFTHELLVNCWIETEQKLRYNILVKHGKTW